MILVHQASRETLHGGIVTEPTRIGWRCAAEPGSAAAPDRAAAAGIALAPRTRRGPPGLAPGFFEAED